MTDDYTSSYPLPENGSTADTPHETRPSNLRDKATDAGGHLLGEARGEAAAVTEEARRQLGDLWSQARSEVTDQAGHPAEPARRRPHVRWQPAQRRWLPHPRSRTSPPTSCARSVTGSTRSAARWRAAGPTRSSTRSAGSPADAPERSSWSRPAQAWCSAASPVGLRTPRPRAPASPVTPHGPDRAVDSPPSLVRRRGATRASPTTSRRRCPATPTWEQR